MRSVSGMKIWLANQCAILHTAPCQGMSGPLSPAVRAASAVLRGRRAVETRLLVVPSPLSPQAAKGGRPIRTRRSAGLPSWRPTPTQAMRPLRSCRAIAARQATGLPFSQPTPAQAAALRHDCRPPTRTAETGRQSLLRHVPAPIVIFWTFSSFTPNLIPFFHHFRSPSSVHR